MTRRQPLLALSVLAPLCVACGTSPHDWPAGVVDVPLTNPDGILYAAPIAIGGQQLYAEVDTGSTTTGVASTACTSGCDGISPMYTPGASAVDEDASSQALYFDQSSWSGEVYRDDFAAGSSAAVPIELVAIDSASDFFRFGDVTQGILGMGPTDLLDYHTTSFLAQAIDAGMPAELAFRVCNDHGDMWLGGFDATAAATPVQYTQMLEIARSEPWYSVQGADMQIAGVDVGLGGLGTTVIDTGTTLTYVPPGVAAAFAQTLNASPGFQAAFSGQTIDENTCVTTGQSAAQIDAALPAMSISFPDLTGSDNTTYTVPATRSYLMNNGLGTWCLAVVATGLGQPSIVGNILQQNFLVVFDLAHQQIGFAPEAGCGNEADVRERVVFPPAQPGRPYWSSTTNPRFRKPRR